MVVRVLCAKLVGATSSDGSLVISESDNAGIMSTVAYMDGREE